MAVKRKPSIKSTFETGDRPTQQEFEDFIDSYVPIETDGAVGFMEVISTASSISRPSETLVAIATGAQGGKTGLIEVLATADVTALQAGAVGREVLSASATASAQGHLGGGTLGVQIFEAITTASAQDHLGIVTASETAFGVVEIASQSEMEAATATDRVVTPANLVDAMTLDTTQATTSGTAFDFTGIRAGIKRITIAFDEVSLTGSNKIIVQLGDSGGIETSGYVGIATALPSGGAINHSGKTDSFPIFTNAAGDVFSGIMLLTLLDSATNTWSCMHAGRVTSIVSSVGGGRKALSGELTQVRVTRDGADTFDAGQLNVMVE